MDLNQSGYILSLEDRYDLKHLDSYPVTPMAYNAYKTKRKQILLDKNGITEYQSKIGSLLYLTIMTRPDILFATCWYSRKCKSPSNFDMEAVDRILYYIMGTKDKGLRFRSINGVTLYATVDASYACHDDMKSHTGCTLHIGDLSGAYQSLSKKQTITADSSTVAEFIGTHTVTKEIMWSRDFLASVGFPQKQATILYEDNMSTIAMIKNKSNGKKTKHIEVRYNLVREQVDKNIIAVKWLETKNMTSDILTKSLSPAPFVHNRRSLLGMNVHSTDEDLLLEDEDSLHDFVHEYDMCSIFAA